ncbi:MAG TPA: DUF4249 domain-containing protein [Chitinophagaceae bacterium]|jgi:uncharacterized protein DUF4249|nr:DUF4249 domain-containing protein [Chitinophagaceae bacterium]
MKRIKRLAFFFSILSLCSCQKVIDLKLHDADIKYVVEGVISNEPGVCTVNLTQSKPFYENNQFPGISGAIVTVKDNDVEFALPETQPGVYETNLINGTPGHVYQLSVTINNNLFTATSKMPLPVLLDTVYISNGPFGEFKFATVGYDDPPGVSNSYRFVQYLNGVKDPAIFWQNDEFTDGQTVLIQLDTGVDKKDDPRNIKSGDTVTIEMLGIDEAVYKYWYSLHFNGGDGGNIATPANPVTNINGGALGYFSAQALDRKSLIVP